LAKLPRDGKIIKFGIKARLLWWHKNASFRRPKKYGMVADEALTVLRSEMMQPSPG